MERSRLRTQHSSAVRTRLTCNGGHCRMGDGMRNSAYMFGGIESWIFQAALCFFGSSLRNPYEVRIFLSLPCAVATIVTLQPYPSEITFVTWSRTSGRV